LVDTRYAGEARGVGTAKILGRIHIVKMQLGSSFYPVSITVLEKSDVEFLFGLDTLRRYNCIIDLGKNVLRVSNGLEANNIPQFEEVPFLSDSEIPSDFNSRSPKESKTVIEDEKKVSSTSVAAPGTSSIFSDAVALTSSSMTSAPVPQQATAPPLSRENMANITEIGTLNDKINQLIALGFTANQARQALMQTGGDVDLAASLLMDS